MGARLAIGIALILGGVLLAHSVQTGGDVRLTDVRFVDASGKPMSALLYVPDGATQHTPAPGILAVHGYINSRETQAPFAIELARRGYVVLALDQTGHGFSAPPAFSAGFGGPAGLAYLASLPFVDRDNIGLEGHSMGGWAVLSAATGAESDYRAIVLAGSTTGLFGTAEGSPTWPRNVAVVFSIWDEFAQLMWAVPRGADIPHAPKLKALFGTADVVTEGRVYGDIDAGTGRILRMPTTTHPGDHLSTEAVADAIDWFERTLTGGHSVTGQVWMWKEFGTLIALCGLIVTLLTIGRMLTTYTHRIPATDGGSTRVPSRQRRMIIAQLSVVPVVTYFPAFLLAERWLPPTAVWPQQITNGLMIWLLVNGAITAIGLASSGFDARRAGLIHVDGKTRMGGSLLVACAAVASGYALLALMHDLFTVDFRFWVVAVKLLAPWHVTALLAYLPVLVVFFVLLGSAAAPLIDAGSTSRNAARIASVLSGGFVVLLLMQYVPLLAGGTLVLGQPLMTIVALQFVVLLAIVGVIIAVFHRATGTVYTGAFINALFIGWVVVAGQATHVA